MSGDAGRYVNAGQVTLVKVLESMATSPLDGLSLERLAAASGASRDACFRAAKTLEHVGWAEPAPGGGWRVTPRAAYVSERVRVAIADVHRRYLGGEI